MDTDTASATGTTNPQQPVALTVSAWCEAVNLSRDWYYSAPEPDRPVTVRIAGRPHVIEAPEAWKARMANRRSISAWCRQAGLSRRGYYNLVPEDRPRMDGRHVVEPVRDWWKRIAAKEGVAA